jgi:hypothetical protein
MLIRNILVPALAGLLYTAACGSTGASSGDMPSAGAAGKSSGASAGAAGKSSAAGGAGAVAGVSTGGQAGTCSRFECPAIVCAPGVNTPPSSDGCCPGCGTGASGSSGAGPQGGSGGSAETGIGGTAGTGGCSITGASAIVCPQTHICAAGESPSKTILCCMSCVPASGGGGG